jgi:quercetin dioxygenase-like cupin family protein
MNKPQIKISSVGSTFKILQIKGVSGMTMPPHYSTKEAVILVEKGQALLKMAEGDHILTKGTSFIIPAGKEHSLIIQKDFKASAIMAVDSEINFI